MQTSLKRLPAFALALLLLLGSLPFAAAAPMPAGWTEAQVEASIPKAERLAEALLNSGAAPDVKSTVYGLLFSDDTLNSLFTSVYQAFSENESTLSSLGLDTSVQSVANALQGWPGVTAVLNGKNTWAEVLPHVSEFRWGVSDKASFGGALAGILSPLNPLLFTLLCSGTYNITPLVAVQGADGYTNAVVPLLQELGCPNVMTQEQFTAHAKENTFYIAQDLANMLFGALDRFLAAPVTYACQYLPGIADYLENDGLSQTVQTLMQPLSVRVAVFSLPGVDRLMENAKLFSSDVDLKNMLEGMDLQTITGADAELKLPEIDLAALAACGGVQNGVYTPNRAQAFIELLNWAIEAVKLNKTALGDAAQTLAPVLNKPTAELAGLVLKLLNRQSAPYKLDVVWSYPAYTPASVDYTPNLTRENYGRMLGMIDGTLDDFLTQFTDMGGLSDTVRKNVYSNKLVSTLVKTVYGALAEEGGEALTAALGLDVSPAGLAASLTRSHPAAARYLAARTSWSRVYPEGLSWGFADGSREGFVSALRAALLPFAPLLRFLLAEGSLTVMDAVTISGSNGYNSAVIPILEGFGCEPADIVPYATYKTGSDAALIDNLLTPVTALLDRLCETPVATLCSLLPQLAYTLDSDLLKQSVENLLYPVRQFLTEFGLESMLPAGLNDLAQLNTDKLCGDLTAELDLGFTLPAPDLAAVKGLGTAEQRESRRTEKDLPAQYTRIAADGPAVLLTVLRYVIGGMKEGGGTELLSSFSLGGSDAPEGMDMMSIYTEKVTEQLKTMTTDETIEWLYGLLFSETPKQEMPRDPDYIPTVIYKAQADHTARNRALAITGGLLLLLGLVLFFVKFDFHKAAERRQRRRLRKKDRRAAGRAAQPTARAGTTQPAARAGTTQPARRAPRQTDGAKPFVPPPPPMTDRELKRAMRQTKKADRLYKKATKS